MVKGFNRNLAMLPLPSWVRWLAANDEPYEELVEIEPRPYLPILNRDGWFYIRRARFSWFELDRVQYEDPYTEGWRFELRMQNARLFRDREYAALKLLRKEGILPKSTLQQLRDYEDKMMIRQTGRTARQFAAQILR